jgi:hypothetical protein
MLAARRDPHSRQLAGPGAAGNTHQPGAGRRTAVGDAFCARHDTLAVVCHERRLLKLYSFAMRTTIKKEDLLEYQLATYVKQCQPETAAGPMTSWEDATERKD